MRQLIAVALFCAGLFCIAQAQVPQTGAGLGAPGGGAPSCTFPTLTTSGSAVVGRWNTAAGNVTISGGNATAMTDLSGNGHNMANTGTIPANNSGPGYNGKTALNFKAANTAAMSAGSVGLSGESLFVYVVGQMLTSTASNGGLVVFGVASQTDFAGTNSGAFFTRNSTNNALASTGLSLWLSTINNNISLATNYRIGFIADQGSALGATTLINNSAGGSVGWNGSGSAGPTGTVVIGARWTSGAVDTSSPWEGPVTEVIVGTTTNGTPLNSTDQNAIDTYLTCQWGT